MGWISGCFYPRGNMAANPPVSAFWQWASISVSFPSCTLCAFRRVILYSHFTLSGFSFLSHSFLCSPTCTSALNSVTNASAGNWSLGAVHFRVEIPVRERGCEQKWRLAVSLHTHSVAILSDVGFILYLSLRFTDFSNLHPLLVLALQQISYEWKK
jgi:hypothetical protein